jgi:hypothetical protein
MEGSENSLAVPVPGGGLRKSSLAPTGGAPRRKRGVTVNFAVREEAFAGAPSPHDDSDNENDNDNDNDDNVVHVDENDDDKNNDTIHDAADDPDLEQGSAPPPPPLPSSPPCPTAHEPDHNPTNHQEEIELVSIPATSAPARAPATGSGAAPGAIRPPPRVRGRGLTVYKHRSWRWSSFHRYRGMQRLSYWGCILNTTNSVVSVGLLQVRGGKKKKQKKNKKKKKKKHRKSPTLPNR